MSESPLISVILPTYNRARLLHRAVDSVLSQTWRHLELIVVDDGSTDDTAQTLAALSDPRLSVIRFDSNRGAPAARNAGIGAARGEFVAFLDSDDHWPPDRLERQAVALSAAPADTVLCVCSIHFLVPGAVRDISWRDEYLGSDAAVARIAAGAGYPTSAWMTPRRALTDAGGFDESLPRLQDFELSLRLAAMGGVLLMDDVLVTIELQSDSISASADRHARALDLVLQRHPDVFGRRSGARAYLQFRAGKYLAMEGRYREALGWFGRSIRSRPWGPRGYAGALLVLTGLFPVFRRARYGR
jgi:glycosyltransferase involved in cell wall biosynthesis